MKSSQEEVIYIEIGADRTKLGARILFQGKHIIILLGGGENHIGSVALSELNEDTSKNVSVQLITRAGHREEEIATQVALKITTAVGVPALVSVGIHVNKITPDEITQININSELLTDKIIDTISFHR